MEYLKPDLIVLNLDLTSFVCTSGVDGVGGGTSDYRHDDESSIFNF